MPDELFSFVHMTWNVSRAWSLIEASPRETVDVPTEKAAQLLGIIRVNKDHAAHADLDKPLIIVPLKVLGFLVIDGWHRIYKATHIEPKEILKGYVLTEDEATLVRER